MKPVKLPHRHLRPIGFVLLCIAAAIPGLAEELPSAPEPQLAALTSATLSGTITDKDGDSIAGAHVTLTRDKQPPLTATTASDGRFAFPNLPPGPFNISVAANGFATQHASGQLQAGETRDLHLIESTSTTTTNVQVTASQTEIAEAQLNDQVKQRVLGAIPNFYVSYAADPAPLTPRQKTKLAVKSLIDPTTFAIIGITAGVQQATNTYDWEQGASGYAKRYAASYGTALTGTMFGSVLFPIIFKQDPRYFYKGTGSVRSRALYAVANSVICKGDNHHWQFNYSSILGSLAASGLSNAYYPAANRADISLTFEGVAIGIGIGAVENLFQEFLIRKLTRHVPPSPPAPAKP